MLFFSRKKNVNFYRKNVSANFLPNFKVVEFEHELELGDLAWDKCLGVHDVCVSFVPREVFPSDFCLSHLERGHKVTLGLNDLSKSI